MTDRTSNRSYYRITPLHVAVAYGDNNLKLIKEILNDETSSVHTRDPRCNTPLRLACMKDNIDLKIVKELVMHGASLETHFQRKYTYRGGDYTQRNGPLGLALTKNLACAKLLIKITVLKHFERDYNYIVGLHHYQYFYCSRSTYTKMCQFVLDCAIELTEMRKNFINVNKDGVSFYTWLQRKRTFHEQLLFSKDDNDAQVMDNMLAMLPILKKFPIYYDVLIEEMVFEVVKRVSRQSLMEKYSEVELCAMNDTNEQNVIDSPKTLVTLNYDCTRLVAKYLSEEDILNFVMAFRL